MFPIRRAALRFLSTPSAPFLSKSRSISTAFPSSLRTVKATPSIHFQRRWASDEAKEVPVSKLQPTAQEEVENAISSDNAATTDAVADSAESSHETPDAVASESSEAAPASEEAGFVSADETMRQETMRDDRSNAGREDRQQRRPITRPTGRPDASEPKKTVYIGNLFFDVTEDDLTRELSQYGKVEHIKLVRDSRGLSKGFGYATFGSIEEATEAIRCLNQQNFEGRRLNMQFAANEQIIRSDNSRRALEQRSKNPPSRTLFIGNMSWDMTDRDLNDLFRPIRGVVDVRIAIDRRTGQPRGFAHADFHDIKSAMEAEKELQGKETYGRKLRIDYSYGASTAPSNQAQGDRRGSDRRGSDRDGSNQERGE